ncbi:hypothetical protein CVU5213_07995 [Campylobacter vulpis]|uniref:GNAT family N-acetyltransferase n=1 Tax=Campylobacter vulpis TaxID=1655500 RepID=A0A2G4R2A8_9BACT|nr:hypothetical protein [Campylobacter vulpis]MBS4241653.1 hypothetical protein [Campylobacter vulpis]MBS4253168.1 hypothetical protein [Campylobacter vulpis]MBS4282401.1 hypothetical protein [Campylobacter vulpis]MBS4332013.1 hypothetical protein [Campylobacter vulpis]MBS4440008.1 hypothetical protein [Campylobacter vulpis]
MHELRFCHLDEVALLQSYIAKEWREEHIFVKSRKVLDFQYLDRKHSRYNVLIAYNTQTKEFDGILGFTLLSQYDKKLKDEWIWTSLWSAKKAYASLGLKLYRHLFELLKIQNTSTAGLSGDSIKFSKLFYDKMDKLYHFYIKNDNKKAFKLAIFKQNPPAKKPNLKLNLKKLSLEEFKNSTLKCHFTPQKSKTYFINRYLKHPFYKYEALGVFKEGVLKAVFFIRIVRAEKAKAVLIVDFWGNVSGNLREAFVEFLQKRRCEFVSLLCYVPKKEYFLKMGFSLPSDDELLPVYYEPFLKQNVAIYFALTSKHKNASFFKGDSDQDRVNNIKCKFALSKPKEH